MATVLSQPQLIKCSELCYPLQNITLDSWIQRKTSESLLAIPRNSLYNRLHLSTRWWNKITQFWRELLPLLLWYHQSKERIYVACLVPCFYLSNSETHSFPSQVRNMFISADRPYMHLIINQECVCVCVCVCVWGGGGGGGGAKPMHLHIEVKILITLRLGVSDQK